MDGTIEKPAYSSEMLESILGLNLSKPLKVAADEGANLKNWCTIKKALENAVKKAKVVV